MKEIYLYFLAKDLDMSDSSPMQIYKKNRFVQVTCCPHLKFSRHGLFSAIKIKTKYSFIVGLKNFYHYLLGIETEEICWSRNKVAVPEHCAITNKTCCVFGN